MKIGSTVRLTYTGTLDDGTVFGIATEDEPLEFQTGMDLTIPGFEKEILCMEKVGEKRTFTVGCYEAYGERQEDRIQEIPRESIPLAKIEKGKRLWLVDDQGIKFPVTVIDITEDLVVVDYNHPLAEQDLTFTVEILAIKDAPEGFVSVAEKQKMMQKEGGQSSETLML